MVASRHPNSRRAGAPAPDRQVGPRPAYSRSRHSSAVGVCRDHRPRLRLVVDNTAPVSVATTVAAEVSDRESGSLGVEVHAWLKAFARLLEARWRLSRRRWVNRHGQFLSTDRLAGLGPAVGLVAVAVFGGLFALRAAQESSAGPLGGSAGDIGSVAAVATSTSSASGVTNSATPVAPDSAVVVVHPGDSLWSIAVDRYPDDDPRAVVDAFVEVNGPSMIRTGQQLIVPPALLGE